MLRRVAATSQTLRKLGPESQVSALQLGDLVEIRLPYETRRGILVAKPDGVSRHCESLCVGGVVVSHYENDVLFVNREWTQKASFIGKPTERKNPAISEKINSILNEKLQVDSSSVLLHVAQYFNAVLRLGISKKQAFAVLYDSIHRLLSHKKLQDTQAIVSVDDIARHIFQGRPLIPVVVSSAITQLKASQADSVKYRKEEVSPAELHATFIHLMDKANTQFEPFMSRKQDLRDFRMFRVVSKQEHLQIEWLKLESEVFRARKSKRPVSHDLHSKLSEKQKKLGLRHYLPGSAIQGLLSKVGEANRQSSFTSNPHLPTNDLKRIPIKYESEDKLILKAIEKVALGVSSISSPFDSLFADVFVPWMASHNLTSPKTPPRIAAAKFLQIAGVHPPWESFYLQRILDRACLDAIPMENNHRAVAINEASGLWSEYVVAQISQKESNPSTHTHKGLVSDTLIKDISPDVVFSNGATSAAESFTRSIKSALSPFSDPCEHLRDRVTQAVYVVDSPSAREIDDGISIEPVLDPNGNLVDHWIHVHIADPTAFLPIDHPLVLFAQLKSTTVYMPDTHYPMLPDELSTKSKMSLRSGSPALTFSARLADNGDIIDYKVGVSVLDNVIPVHYHQLDTLLDYEDVFSSDWSSFAPWTRMALDDIEASIQKREQFQIPDENKKELQTLHGLIKKHFDFRSRNGCFSFEDITRKIHVSPYEVLRYQRMPNRPVVHEKQNAPTIQITPQLGMHLSPAQKTVSESMIIAGRVAARFCLDHGLSVPFRGQASLHDYGVERDFKYALDDIELPKSDREIIKTKTQLLLSAAMESRNSMGIMPYFRAWDVIPYFTPSVCDKRPIAHFAMGIPGISVTSSEDQVGPSQMVGYVKTTSPLRRYTDLLVHYQIKSVLLQQKPPITENELHPIVSRSRSIERTNKNISRVAEDRWISEYIRRREVLNQANGSDILAASKGEMPPVELSGPPKIFGHLANYEGKGPRNQPIYHAVIKNSQTLDAGVHGRSILPRALILELGGFEVDLLVPSQMRTSLTQGTLVKCSVWKIDNYSHRVVMAMV